MTTTLLVHVAAGGAGLLSGCVALSGIRRSDREMGIGRWGSEMGIGTKPRFAAVPVLK